MRPIRNLSSYLFALILLAVSATAQTPAFDTLNAGIVRVHAIHPSAPDSADALDDTGTGLVLSNSNGVLRILTARHVVHGALKIGVAFVSDRTKEVPAVLLRASSESLDLAVLEVTVPARTTPAVPSDFQWKVNPVIRAGLHIWTINGSWEPAPNTISKLDHEGDVRQFQYTATAVGQGYSGAPIFDDTGRLIGIHTATTPMSDYKLALAVKIESAIQTLDALGYATSSLNALTGPNAEGGAGDADSFVRLNITSGGTQWLAFLNKLPPDYLNFVDPTLRVVFESRSQKPRMVAVSDRQISTNAEVWRIPADPDAERITVCFGASRSGNAARKQFVQQFAVQHQERNRANFLPLGEPALRDGPDGPCNGLATSTAAPQVESPAFPPTHGFDPNAARTPSTPDKPPCMFVVNCPPSPARTPQTSDRGFIIVSPPEAYANAGSWIVMVPITPVDKPLINSTVQVVMARKSGKPFTASAPMPSMFETYTLAKAQFRELASTAVVCFSAVNENQATMFWKQTFSVNVESNTRAAFLPVAAATVVPFTGQPCQ